MYDKVPFHPDQSINSKRTSYTQSESSALFADLSSNNDSSYADTNIEIVQVEVPEKRKRGRPRKYPSLPNNGKTFNCVPTSRFLVYPKGSPLIKNNMLIVAKLIYHRSYPSKST